MKVKKKKKYDILKSFEIFNREALSVLKDKLIEIVLIETDNIFSNSARLLNTNNLFNIDFKKNDSAQITVINDKQTYDLLSNTWKRHKKKINGNKNEKNIKCNVYNQLDMSERLPHF